MSPLLSHSQMFKNVLLFWNLFGLWPGRRLKKYYRCFSYIYLVVILLFYSILLTLNLVYTPRKIEFLIREVIFYFTAFNVTSKVLMVIVMRDKIIEAFNLLDSEEMNGEDEKSNQKIIETQKTFKNFFKTYMIFANIAFISQVLVPVFLHITTKSNVDLPICKYYFLTDDLLEKYFALWFFYQAIGIYAHMIYNVSVDSFVAGLLMQAIVQCQVLNAKILDIKPTDHERDLEIAVQEQIQIAKLRKCLRRFDHFLKYCKLVQEIINVTMFVQFGMSMFIICVVMCGLLLPSSPETMVFMVVYFFAMTMEIFLPGYLGTQLTYECHKLAFAAYNTEWIPRSESFKKSIKIFVERVNIPIQMSGLKMFPLSLFTFTSIFKSAYSFFTLIRNMQNK